MLNPSEFIAHYDTIGERKTKSSALKLFLLAILAGLFIALGAAATNMAAHGIESVPVVRMICGFIFPAGLIMILLTGTELVTGNCLITISILSKHATLKGMMRNLGIVYLGNFVGALLLAAACAYCGQLNYSGGGLAVYSIKLAAGKCALSFGNALVLGILCNLLVCAAVMCALCAKDVVGKAVGAFVPIFVFVLCGFEHCVANMFFVPVGLFALTVPSYAQQAAAIGLDVSGLTWMKFLLNNLLPVTIGNLIGGCAFAALIWVTHKQDHKLLSGMTE